MGEPLQQDLRPRRDVLIVPLPGDQRLVLTCDVAGGVGPKPADAVPAPGAIVGRFTARVALMELLSCGARPLALVAGLAVEPEPTGRAIRDGIAAELAEAGYGDLPVTGSMEKNMATVATGVCVTAVGMVSAADLLLGHALPGDLLVAVGQPKVGHAVRLGDQEIADVATVQALLGHPAVHGIIPAGSGGILPECLVLAEEAGCVADIDGVDHRILTKSAGPATCLVAAIEPGALGRVSAAVRQPVWPVGWLRRKS